MVFYYDQVEIIVKISVFLIGLQNVDFPEVCGGPEGLRKVREGGRMNFLQLSAKSDAMVPSYDQKDKKLTFKKVTTISM